MTAFQEKKGKSIQAELELGILKFSSGTFSNAFAKKSPFIQFTWSSPQRHSSPTVTTSLLSSVQASSPCIQRRVYQQEKELLREPHLNNTSGAICD